MNRDWIGSLRRVGRIDGSGTSDRGSVFPWKHSKSCFERNTCRIEAESMTSAGMIAASAIVAAGVKIDTFASTSNMSFYALQIWISQNRTQ